MGRLIDADALIEAMKKREEECENFMTCPSWWSAYTVIDKQPTAYDVEAVVAELENFETWKELLIYDLSHREREIIEKAISIVRGKE